MNELSIERPARARSSGSWGPTARASRRRSACCWAILHPTGGTRRVLGHDITRDEPGDPAQRRLPAGRHRLLRHDERSGAAALPRRRSTDGRRRFATSSSSAWSSSERDLRRQVRDYSRGGCARSSASSRPSSTTRSWPSSTSRPRGSTRSCSARSTRSSTSASAPVARSSSRRTSCPRSNGSASASPSSAAASSSRSATWASCWRAVDATSRCASPGPPPDARRGGRHQRRPRQRDGILSCQLEGDPEALSWPHRRACAMRDLHDRAGAPRGGVHGVLRGRRDRRRTAVARLRSRPRRRLAAMNGVLFRRTFAPIGSCCSRPALGDDRLGRHPAGHLRDLRARDGGTSSGQRAASNSSPGSAAATSSRCAGRSRSGSSTRSRCCSWASWRSASRPQAIAGEREKGTLEVVLARPISRRGLVATLFVAGLLFVGVLLALQLVEQLRRRGRHRGRAASSRLGRMAQLWLAGWLLFVAFMALAFTASAMSDRIGPALGHPARLRARQLPRQRDRVDLAGRGLAAGLVDVHLVKAQQTLTRVGHGADRRRDHAGFIDPVRRADRCTLSRDATSPPRARARWRPASGEGHARPRPKRRSVRPAQ